MRVGSDGERRGRGGHFCQHDGRGESRATPAEEDLRCASPGEAEPLTVPHRGQSGVEFGSQSDQREAVTQRRFEVPPPEALQEDEREEQGEHEVDDRRGFVFVNVIQPPMGRRGVEAPVLDVPSPVARTPARLRGQSALAERRGPIP